MNTNPLTSTFDASTGIASTPSLMQPVLAGLEGVRELIERDRLAGTAETSSASASSIRTTARARGLVAATGRTRRRYWSVRDLSRRIWLGRGYELLREIIRAGILPATRSARSWWIDDTDAATLVNAFDDRAGKVRAFRGLDAWLRERCYVAPLTPEVETLIRLTRSGLAWRGLAYLPTSAWTEHSLSDGAFEYHHRHGAIVEALEAVEGYEGLDEELRALRDASVKPLEPVTVGGDAYRGDGGTEATDTTPHRTTSDSLFDGARRLLRGV